MAYLRYYVDKALPVDSNVPCEILGGANVQGANVQG